MLRGVINKYGFISVGALFLLTTSFFCLPVSKNVNAEERLDVKVNITPHISLTTSKDVVEMEITPSSAADFSSDSLVARVTTNNFTGYTLNMSTKGTDSSLVNTTNSSYKILSDFSGSVTSSTMSANKWGYSLNATDFYAVPLASNAAVLKSTNSPAKNDNTTVTYGAKINQMTPAGDYEDVVIFTAYINSDAVPEANRTIFDIRNMQEMTSLVCSNTTTPSASATEYTWLKTEDTSLVPRTSLTDTRDGSIYLVSKLADGNCWMSQNLEYELDLDPLSSNDTALYTTSSWTATNETHAVAGREWKDSSSNVDKSVEPDLDKKYLKNGTTISSTPSGSKQEYRWERVGIYYNWAAANATNEISSSDTGAKTDSICPKGWQIPNASGAKSFDNLIYTVYGIGSVPGDYGKISQTPLNFVYAGIINDWSNNIATNETLGSKMVYWTNTIKDGTNAYTLSGDSSIGLSGQNSYDNKVYGASIRCVAK